MDAYRTIAAAASARLARKRSRFLAFVEPVVSQADVEMHLSAAKRAYHDATHVCSAYRLLADGTTIAFSDDDGEPHGSAGLPMLQQLEKADLLNTLAIVVRYFGGVKLGVGGLIRAYTDAVAAALDTSRIVLRTLEITLLVTFPPAVHGQVMATIHRSGAQVRQIMYDDNARVHVGLPPSGVDGFVATLTESTGGQATVEVIG